MSMPLTNEILTKIAPFHEGLDYYIKRDVRTVYEAYRDLKELGFNVFDKVIAFNLQRNHPCSGQKEFVYFGSYDFIIGEVDTNNDWMLCNIAHYSDSMQCLQFFVNKEKMTIGRPHYNPIIQNKPKKNDWYRNIDTLVTWQQVA